MWTTTTVKSPSVPEAVHRAARRRSPPLPAVRGGGGCDAGVGFLKLPILALLLGGAVALRPATTGFAADGTATIAPNAATVATTGPVPAGAGGTADETTMAAGLEIPTAHIVLVPVPAEGIVQVAEVWTVLNRTSRTRVAGPDGAGLRFSLPAGAEDLVIEDERIRASASVHDDALLIAAPFPPGEHQVVVRYAVPYRGAALRIDRVLDLGVALLQVVVSGADAGIASPVLGSVRRLRMSDQTVAAAEGRDLSAGTNLSLVVTSLPEAQAAIDRDPNVVVPLAGPSISPDVLTAVGVLAAVVAVLVLLAYPGVLDARPSALGSAREKQYRRVVDEIVGLDDRYSHGGVDSGEYTRRRAILLTRAVELARRREEELA